MRPPPAAAPRPGGLRLGQLFFNGAGRLGRLRFGAALLAVALAWRVWKAIAADPPLEWVNIPVGMGLLAAACTVLSKRLHDLSLAGWWSVVWVALFALAATGEAPASPVQVAAGAMALALSGLLAAWPGERRFNRFGPPPGEAWPRS